MAPTCLPGYHAHGRDPCDAGRDSSCRPSPLLSSPPCPALQRRGKERRGRSAASAVTGKASAPPHSSASLPRRPGPVGQLRTRQPWLKFLKTPIRTKGEGKTKNTPRGWAAKGLPPAGKTEGPKQASTRGLAAHPTAALAAESAGAGDRAEQTARRPQVQSPATLFPTGCSPSSCQVSRSPGFLFSTREPMIPTSWTCCVCGGDDSYVSWPEGPTIQ